MVDGYSGRHDVADDPARARDELGWEADGGRHGLDPRVQERRVAARFGARPGARPHEACRLAFRGSRPNRCHTPGVPAPICTDSLETRRGAVVLVGVAACRPEFQLKNFTTNEALYTASLRAYDRHHWDNAIAGFEKLTTDLPARDTLLPRSYWYLASAHEHQDEHLLAAQSFEPPRRVVSRRFAGRRRRARDRAFVSPTVAKASARPDVRRDRARVVQHADRPLPDVAARGRRAEGDRRAGELVRDQGLRRRDVLLPSQGIRLGHHLLQGRAHEVREHADGARRGASLGRGVQGRRNTRTTRPSCARRCASATRTTSDVREICTGVPNARRCEGGLRSPRP